MGLDQEQIARVVEEVVRKYRAQQALSVQEQVSPTIFSQNDGIFVNIDDALNAAEQAFEGLMELTLENRKNIIAAMRAASLENAEYLAKMAHEETGLGKVEHKKVKREFFDICKKILPIYLENLDAPFPEFFKVSPIFFSMKLNEIQ